MRNRTRPTSDAAARALPGTAWIAALCCAAAFAAGCATPDAPASPRSSEALRAMLAKGDLAGADALLASNPGAIDARRALDLAIRSGRVDATKHFLPRAGVDTPLDPDGTTPLIRAVLDAPPTERGRLVALLLEAGAQPDLVDRYGRSAREYATTRNRGELFEPPRDPSGLPAFAAWFGASPALPRAAAPAARPAGRDAAGRPATAAEARAAAAAARQAGRTPPSSKAAAPNARAVASGAPAVTPVSSRGGSARPAPSARAVDVAALLRASPWTPVAVRGEPSAERVGLRFHADGVVDVLRVRTGSGARIAPMTGAAGAWRVEGGRLQVAVVADAFVAACSGAPRADGALVLACEERTAPDRLAAAARTDFARTLLEDVGANGGRPSLLAIASDRAGRASDAGDGMGVAARPRIEATLAGLGPAACRPGPGRPPVPSAGTRLGDWYAFDVRRFEAVSPLSGRMCPQTSARAAALSACSGDSCRSVGGCPAGQVSALAGLPGVDAGWVGCDANPVAARERALAACRADLGCDCQVVALSGRNLNTLGGGACPVPSQTRAPAEAG